jgi:chromosome partitioning protein
MKILTITGYKGGVGKSTTAIHLATFLSEQGKTILVDGDQNRTALAWAARGSLPFLSQTSASQSGWWPDQIMS